jgi:dihydropteroate synthase
MNSKDTKSKSNSSIFSTEKAIVMGILNLNNDSFYDGGKYIYEKQIIERCKLMLDEGASIIDIGAQSSRPGATQFSSKEEIKKLLPIITLLKNIFDNITISIDTFWGNTAKECIQAGADIINDISAGNIDKNMFSTIAKQDVPYIMMHMQGIPQNMQNNPSYKNVTMEVLTFFKYKIDKLHQLGFDKIVIDPGFGFGKTIEHNYQLLNNLAIFKSLELPILSGISRKSMIYDILDITSKDALNGTSIANTIALNNGANILRVHDVKEAIECIKITTFAKNNC